MTMRNLMAYRVGRPLKRAPDNDATKMQHAVTDKANYAAMVPELYSNDNDDADYPYSYSPDAPHYQSPGSMAILMRELRFTFPEDSSGFTEYATYLPHQGWIAARAAYQGKHGKAFTIVYFSGPWNIV